MTFQFLLRIFYVDFFALSNHKIPQNKNEKEKYEFVFWVSWFKLPKADHLESILHFKYGYK